MKAEIIETLYKEQGVIQNQKSVLFRRDTDEQELYLLNMYPDMRYQNITGFGGAITEAVGVTLSKMGKEKAREIIETYFGKEDGIGYRMIRTHMDSCDFCENTYEAVSASDDENLESFSIERHEQYIIPYIKMAYESAGEKLPVMLTPWSPPAFMKTNNARLGGHLKKEYYALWAKYICRYIEEYEKRGIKVGAVSVQNEPNAVQKWDSCLFTAGEEQEFLSEYLYPKLIKSGHQNVDVYIWDHNKERLFDRACAEINEKTDKQIAGMAFHWYSGDHFDAVRMVREKFPDKKLMFTEGCIEYSRFDRNQLANAQMYAHDMIGNLKAGMNAFCDWNIALNQEGGPNHAGNYCEAPVMCNVRDKTVEYKLSFFYLEHFSKYIVPGATKIGTTVYTEGLEQVGFENPDGSLILIIVNRSNQDKPVTLRMSEDIAELTVKGNSVQTITVTKEK